MNRVGCKSHEKISLMLATAASRWPENDSFHANVGGISAEGADAGGLRQKFRESKVAQDEGRVNAMGLRYPPKRAKMWHRLCALVLIVGYL
jgi:hypothetical protein